MLDLRTTHGGRGRRSGPSPVRRLIALACGLAACTSDAAGPVTAPVAAVDVTPATTSVEVGTTRRLTATPRDADGAPLTGRGLTWSSANPVIASVDTAGVVTGVAPGTVMITATSEGKAGTASVIVTPGPPTQLVFTVQPTSAVVRLTKADVHTKLDDLAAAGRRDRDREDVDCRQPVLLAQPDHHLPLATTLAEDRGHPSPDRDA